MMNVFPIQREVIDAAIKQVGIKDFENAIIREMVGVEAALEKATGEEFVKMELGIPGIEPPAVGVEAQIAALRKGVPQFYPNVNGIPELKQEASRFVKAFIDVDVNPAGCIPVSGTMQGTYACFTLVSQLTPNRCHEACFNCRGAKEEDDSQLTEKGKKILFIDPGFPVQKMQCNVIGVGIEHFDVYNYRGKKLGDKLEEYFRTGEIAAVIYSNPNNPSWVCLCEEELATIGRLAKQYDVIVLEDLAYFAMDFRKDFGTPFQPPYQPTVAKYTDQYILLISGSKAFSYAGERIAVVCISDALYNREYPALAARYGNGLFGNVFAQRILYALSSGTCHSAQFALAAMLKAASDGTFPFREKILEYGRRAERMKDIFLKNGFHLVYADDLGDPIADGFYFTIGYKNMTNAEIAYEFLRYGMCAINLVSTGSGQQGLRICTSFIKPHQFSILEERVKLFHKNHDLESK